MTAQRLITLRLSVILLPPLSHKFEPDDAFYNVNIEAVRATEAGYNPKGRYMKAEKVDSSKDHREKIATVHFFRFNELSKEKMKVCSDLALDAAGPEFKIHEAEYQKWANRWTSKTIGAGETSWFYAYTVGEMMYHDLEIHLFNLKLQEYLSRTTGDESIATQALEAYNNQK